jgi:DHA3 family macrolide efflux protein-like MFS transporter
MGADAAIAVATLGLALFMLAGNTELWLIFAVLAVRSTGAGIQTPAVAALVPQLVPDEHLLRINGLNQSIQAGMMLIAPAVAAALYATLPIEMIFFVDVSTALVGIGLLALIPVAKVPRPEGSPSYLTDLIEGIRYAHGHHLVRWLLGLNAVVMVLAGAPSFLTPLMVARSFGDEVWKLTGLELSFSIGMLIAGATIGWWGDKLNRLALILLASAAFGVLGIGMGLSTNLWVLYLFMFGIGIAVPAFTTPMTTALQQSVEPETQGRVFGFFGIVTSVAMPLGMALFGPLSNVYSVEVVLIGTGIATLIAVGLALLPATGRRALALGSGSLASS